MNNKKMLSQEQLNFLLDLKRSKSKMDQFTLKLFLEEINKNYIMPKCIEDLLK